MIKKIISIDMETDGLWGKGFWIAGIVYENGKEVDKINVAIKNPEIKEDWVKENVIPLMNKAKEVVFVKTYEELLQKFANFYNQHRGDYTVLWHMGYIVESYLFRELHNHGLIGDWDAPYTPIEVAEILRQSGEKSDSVDSYIEKYNISINDYGTTHNPLYDCEATAKVYFDIKKRKAGITLSLDVRVAEKLIIENAHFTYQKREWARFGGVGPIIKKEKIRDEETIKEFMRLYSRLYNEEKQMEKSRS